MGKHQSKSSGLSLECIEPNAAGIAVGATEIFVAVPADRDQRPVRRFKTFTDDLRLMASWLIQCQITTVAMESTGVYWLPPYEMLEETGIRVCLVNSKHVKNVPGRKTDISDCQWLQYLHSVGLLRASFRPDSEICAIRALSRHRSSLIEISAVGKATETPVAASRDRAFSRRAISASMRATTSFIAIDTNIDRFL